MMYLLWLVFHVPGLKFLFYRVLYLVWNSIVSSLEEIVHRTEKADFLAILEAMKHNIGTGAVLSKWYTDKEFEWSMDPMGGALDFSSKPWVTLAKNYGDCDDMMFLAEVVLKDKYDEGHRCFIYSKTGKGHAVYLLRDGAKWYVMSNQLHFGTFDTMEEAANWFYGSDTQYTYVY